MGNIREWDKLAVKGLEYLMPFTLKRDKFNKIYVQINYDLEFYTCVFGLKGIRYPDLKRYLKFCQVRDWKYKLTDGDEKQLDALYPNFFLTYFTKWV